MSTRRALAGTGSGDRLPPAQAVARCCDRIANAGRVLSLTMVRISCRRRRSRGVHALGVLALLVALGAVEPATGGIDATDQLTGSRVAAAPTGRGGVGLQAGNADSHIVIKSDDARNEMVITDQAGVRVNRGYPGYGEFCNQISETKVRCQLFEPGGIRAALGPGDDSIEIDSTHLAPVVIAGYRGDDTITVSNPADATTSRLQGNGGADVLMAGASDAHLSGGGGADIIKGSGGDDLLRGKRGADTFIGGAGNDRLEAENFDEDRSIRCGSGNDAAEIDRDIDPIPRQCERVSRR